MLSVKVRAGMPTPECR